MKRIRILRNLGQGLPRLLEGQIAEVDAETAARLIGAALAEHIRDVPDQVSPPAVPEPVVESKRKRRQPEHAKRQESLEE